LSERALAAAATNLEPANHRLHRLARPVLVGSLSLGVLAGGNVLAGHYIPTYGRVLADMPIAGSLLQSAGVKADQVTPASDTASSSGFEIHVAGGYADAYRTLIFLEINGEPMAQPQGTWRDIAEATLTDQFGHVYKRGGAAGQSGISFQPLTGPAVSGAHLALHITKIYNQEPPPNDANIDSIYGDWTLHLDLSQDPGGEGLPLPAAVTAGGTTYTVTALRHSSQVLHIEWTMTGSAVDRYEQLAYSYDPMVGPPPETRAQMEAIMGHRQPQLLDPGGQPTGYRRTGVISDMTFPKNQPATGAVTTLIHGSGHYTLEISFGGVTASIPIDVP
jgi:hypothetical protein